MNDPWAPPAPVVVSDRQLAALRALARAEPVVDGRGAPGLTRIAVRALVAKRLAQWRWRWTADRPPRLVLALETTAVGRDLLAAAAHLAVPLPKGPPTHDV